MTDQNDAGTDKGGGGITAAKVFWVVACLEILLILIPTADEANHPRGQFSGLVVFTGLVFMGLVALLMLILAIVRRPVAYLIGLGLLAVPTVYSLVGYTNYFISEATRPTEADMAAAAVARKARHGNFAAPADQALAEAIVAGDAAKVAALAPAANLKAEGRDDSMTFMRLALEDGHAVPEVVAALLRAGVDPDQDRQVLFGVIRSNGESVETGVMVGGKNDALLRAVIDAGVDLNQLDLNWKPRFFALLRWPEGLAYALEHGANVEAEENDGYTAIMLAATWDWWPAVEVLLAHGARIDKVDKRGEGLREIVPQKLQWYRTYLPKPPAPAALLALEERLK